MMAWWKACVPAKWPVQLRRFESDEEVVHGVLTDHSTLVETGIFDRAACRGVQAYPQPGWDPDRRVRSPPRECVNRQRRSRYQKAWKECYRRWKKDEECVWPTSEPWPVCERGDGWRGLWEFGGEIGDGFREADAEETRVAGPLGVR